MGAIFFDPDDIVSTKVRKANVPDAQNQAINSLLNYRLNKHPIDFYAEAFEFTQDALRNMIGVFKTYPKFEFDEKGNIDKFDPIIEAVPYEDMFFSPEATWKDYFKFPIVHRIRKRFDELKGKGFKNLDKVEEATILESDVIKQQRNNQQGSPFAGSSISGIDKNNVYLYEIWTFLEVEKDKGLKSVKYLMAGNENSPQVVISELEVNDLPFKRRGDTYNRPPFIVGTALPESHSMYGKSYPEITEALQREVNSIRNQKREAVALSIRSPLLVSKSANINLQSLMNRRMGGIVLGDEISPNSVRELQTNTNFDSSYTELQVSDNDFNQITSVSPNRLGISPRGEQTATETRALEGNANASTNSVTRNLINSGFIPCFENLLRMEQEYETDDFIAKITGVIGGFGGSEDEIPTRESIEGDFDLEVNKGAGKQANLNRLMTMMQLGNQSNATVAQLVQGGVMNASQATFVNPSEVMKRAYALLDEKGTELFVQAQPPQVQGQGVGGVASQTGVTANTDAGGLGNGV